MKHFETIYDSKKLLAMLSERGVTYGENAEAGVFRGKLYVREGRAKEVDYFILPVPISAEVQDSLPVDQTPFSAKFKPGLDYPKTCTEPTEVVTNQKMFDKIFVMDNDAVGTADYMGLAYFWHPHFKHTLRDASAVDRVKVHAAFLANGLVTCDDSKAHREIINTIFKGRNTGL